MPGIARTLKAAAALEAAINQEKASGLGRTGAMLEKTLASCQALTEAWATATPAQREGLRARYLDERALAQKLLWYLTVQREAIGILNQDDLYRQFPLPPAKLPGDGG